MDTAGAAYISGDTGDNAVSKLSADGGGVDYRYTLSNFHAWRGNGVALDSQGGIYIMAYADSYYSAELPVTPGAFDVTSDNIWLTKISESALISGKVTDINGLPLAGIKVVAGSVFSATTDADGAYAITVSSGGYAVAPVSPGYFWSPQSRSVSVSPDATGQDFTGKGIVKTVQPGSSQVVNYGDTLTYTVGLVAPQNKTVSLYDAVPTYTVFVSGSLSAPPNVTYNAGDNTVGGVVTLTQNIPVTITFATRAAITGTAGFAPRILNRACVYPFGGSLNACEWSEQTVNNTVLHAVYLPLILH